VSLKIICDRSVDFAPLATKFVRWSAATESKEISSSHVGIAVMPDDDWSRGKCGVKVLQYMAAGLPVIGNPVGVHIEMVPGAGLLADSTEAWIDCVRRLHDPKLRSHFGTAGVERVREEYSIEAGAAAWIGLFETLVRRVAC
jgi:glycosyltransferase involved in cell wall biosynthesis